MTSTAALTTAPLLPLASITAKRMNLLFDSKPDTYSCLHLEKGQSTISAVCKFFIGQDFSLNLGII